ncbi:insulinase family protein [Candidatus Woesearchaeota archaeon]|nr:insulinase family protein [Candidatus Woesearchaeota archaeon]
MKKYKLKNGITLIFERNSSKSVAVEVMFKFGSNFESKNLAGAAHFLEHMLFEGTKNRKDSREIANEIEKYGGEFNAYTTGDRTTFFIKIINKRLDVALDILSDMVANPIFDGKILEKEKKVVLKEINMVNDDPRSYQWILFHKALFEKHPAKNPTYGSVETVKSFSRNSILDYYKSHYLPNNMIISVVGNAGDVKNKVQKYFGSLKPGKMLKRIKFIEIGQKKQKTRVERGKTFNSYMVMGYKTVPRTNKDSYVFEVISAILGRGQSGWIFDEIRNKKGLAYQVGVNSEHESDYGVFAVYTNLDKKNIEQAKKIILEQFKRLGKISKKDLEEAKTYIEGNYVLQMEDNFHKADNLAVWETIKDVKLSEGYIKNIKKVTAEDVKRIAKKHLNDRYTLVVIEQEK